MTRIDKWLEQQGAPHIRRVVVACPDRGHILNAQGMPDFGAGKCTTGEHPDADRANAVSVGRAQQLTVILSWVAGRHGFAGGGDKHVVKHLRTVEATELYQTVQGIRVAFGGKAEEARFPLITEFSNAGTISFKT